MHFVHSFFQTWIKNQDIVCACPENHTNIFVFHNFSLNKVTSPTKNVASWGSKKPMMHKLLSTCAKATQQIKNDQNVNEGFEAALTGVPEATNLFQEPMIIQTDPSQHTKDPHVKLIMAIKV